MLRAPSTKMSAFFAVAFFVNGVVLPFFPVFLSARGLGGDEIALVLGVPFLLRLVSMPIVTGLADRAADRRVVVVGLTVLVLALALALWPLTDRTAVIAVATLMLVVSYCVGPLADAIALSMERRGDGVYGKMRLWGSASFILGNLSGGWVLHGQGVSAIFALMLAGFAAAVAATALIPPPGPMPPVAHAAALTVNRRPAFLAVLLAAGLIQASHAGLYGFATLSWQNRGFDDVTIGAFWAIGVVAEIILFWAAHRIPARVTPVSLMVIGGAIGVVRWALFAVDTDLATTAALQVMHAGSFALGHIGMMRFIRETVPEQRSASAQGTYVIFLGVGMAAASFVAGRLWTEVGDQNFLAMSAFCAAGVTILTIARSGASRLPSMAGARLA
jgi:PPP family 3-phenylpropionic acid transporter